jgi:sulfate transport system substrate-binding protein
MSGLLIPTNYVEITRLLNRRTSMTSNLRSLAAAAALVVAGLAAPAFADQTILNVSYDPTRELYKAYDARFIEPWAATHDGEVVTVDQSHGGSGAQARAVIDGQPADV